ncbi:hypothetical protein NK718_19800 [Alsobacter sp. SYSU M60028]|uniref:Neuromedin U n=1 Tax=Alsobacter ponti TaxID=2962936 RepID=A0ABT1LJ74_9HYPH|nr:hypothetical protein [Alsobacter ponti]MCP8940775.1 hypothetical protein [Alsobacter ponti]
MNRFGAAVAGAALVLGVSAGVAAAQATAEKPKPKARKPAIATAVVAPKAEAPTTEAGGGDINRLRHAAQNPVADLISVPLQNNTNFGYGPYRRPQNVLDFQPVIPFKITPEWNVITRWVTPIVDQPRLSPTENADFGLGNVQPSIFLSPAQPGKIIWGAGPVFWLPTATGRTLGVNKWGAGPTAVALTIEGPWVAGVLVNNIWAGTHNQRVNQMLLQPFVNYNLPDGWYLTSSPIVTADWLADSGDRWKVPIGGGFGRLFKIDRLPVNAQIQAFYNVVRPDYGATWTLRFQVQALFPAI